MPERDNKSLAQQEGASMCHFYAFAGEVSLLLREAEQSPCPVTRSHLVSSCLKGAPSS